MIAARALLHGLIDYAGLFPPAALDMATAISRYQDYLAGEHGWMLGSFVVRASQLDEFTRAFDDVCCNERAAPWSLSVIGSGNMEADREAIDILSEGAVFLDALELKAADASEAKALLAVLPQNVQAFVEFPFERQSEMLPVLNELHAMAKVRTGGVTPEAFPSSAALADFLTGCARTKLAFKATAGLHHPVRSMQRLTYEQDSASTFMHGFINVFVAAMVAYSGADASTVQSVLEEENPKSFVPGRKDIRWKDYSFNAAQITTVRETFARSFGSCSFTEPVDELKAMGWL